MELLSIAESPGNPGVERAAADGTPVIGYFCSYVPVEVLTAAGCLPLRLRGTGSEDSAAADALMSSRVCTYVRHTVALALDGRYGFLRGVVCCNTCDHVRRALDVLRHRTSIGFLGFLSVPRNARESLYPYYRDEVGALVAGLERLLARRVDEAGLRAAAALHVAVRERLRLLDGLRARERPPLSGAELLAAAVASRVTAPADFIDLADRLREEREGAAPGGPPPRARLLLAGNALDEPAFVRAVESQGAAVVADTLCFGSRGAAGPVPADAPDPLEAICRRTFFQTPCARMIGNFPDRLRALLDLVRERAVDGVVFQRLKFCDPWGGEAHMLRRRLRERGVPLLVIEREYGTVNAGQVRTRVQAFLEMIEAGRRRGRAEAAG